ncbi:MAG TPA: slipin family protein [Candidatus Acidoferrum sp.]|nr:slipin family protein [Candidatus Acidoferrum sp.]
MADQKPSVGVAKLYSFGVAAAVDMIIVIVITGIAYYLTRDIVFTALSFFVVFFIVLALSLRILNQWNRMAVLRLGRYVGIIGPGPYLIIPIIDSTPIKVDLRVISTAFKAEKTLTKDNVPVDVDAILFWQVRNPENAVLNVQSYYDSVLLASQTAMRDIIGKSELSMMLAGRDVIGEDIQKLIEQRVTNWGIDATSVEIRDVTIPGELQNAMARVATSDREKQARVILAESETLAADKMIEAAQKYETDPYAMQLRALNMMYEISLAGKNVMVFIPTETKGFAMPLPFGVMGMKEYLEQQKGGTPKPDKRKPTREPS